MTLGIIGGTGLLSLEGFTVEGRRRVDELERQRTVKGVALKRYTIFAVAQKPSDSGAA